MTVAHHKAPVHRVVPGHVVHHRAPGGHPAHHRAPVGHHPGHKGHHHASGPGGTHHRSTPHRATIVAFDSPSYTATIVYAQSPDVQLAGVLVSRAISSSLMVVGAVAAVFTVDVRNPADSMVVGVY